MGYQKGLCSRKARLQETEAAGRNFRNVSLWRLSAWTGVPVTPSPRFLSPFLEGQGLSRLAHGTLWETQKPKSMAAGLSVKPSSSFCCRLKLERGCF